MNNIWQRISLVFVTVVTFTRSLGWSRQTWTRIIIWAVFLLIFIVGVRSCSHGGATGASSVGNAIWVLMIGGLITAAVRSQDKPYLAWSFTGLALLILIVLIGKIDSVFSWAVIGLPIFAATGIWGMTRIDATTNGRMKSFLGFSSCIVIIAWMCLFYDTHPIKDTGFIKTVFFPTDELKGIFVIFLAIFFFAIWKRSKIAYIISFIVFLTFVGDTMIENMTNRFPDKLTPSVSQKTKSTWENVWDSLLREINESVAKKPPTPPTTPQTKAPASAPTVSKPAPASQPVETTKRVAPQSTTPTVSRVNRYIIPVTGSPPYSQRIQTGNWSVSPSGTMLKETWEDKPRPTEGSVVIVRETIQCFFPPPGAQEIVLTRKN